MDVNSGTRARVVRMLVGDGVGRQSRWIPAAFGFSVVIAAVVAVTGPRSILLTISYPLFVIPVSPAVGSLLTVGWVAVAAVPGYYRDGLVVSWLLLFCPLVSGPLADELLFFSMMEGSQFFITTTAAATAVLLGTVGYFVGTTIRRNRTHG